MTLFPILIASFLGSPHCVGMCGGFVGMVPCQSHHRSIAHLAYNSGRLTTYLLLGCLAGIFGHTLNSVGEPYGLFEVASYLATSLLLLWGFIGLVNTTWTSKMANFISGWWTPKVIPIFSRLYRMKIELHPGFKSYILGILTTLIPCGWLYAFVAVAASSGNAWSGAQIMAIFWLGTLPALVSLGGFSARVLQPLHQLYPRLTPALMFCAGLFCLSSHFRASSNSADSQCHHASSTLTGQMPVMSKNP